MQRRVSSQLGLAIALAAVILIPSGARATVITTGCGGGSSCTLTQLITGGQIQVDDLIFSGFTNFTQNSATTKFPNSSLIIVTGLDDGGLDPGPGLRFELGGQFNVTAGQAMDLITTFLVAEASGSPYLIKDSSITLVSNSASGANSASGVEQTLYEFEGGSDIYTHVVDTRPSEAFNVLYSGTTFDPLESIFNSMTLRVYPGAGNATLNVFEIRFSEQAAVPEPGALSMMALGLLSAAVLIRRRRIAA
jgi:PEP-CTERM motif